MDELRDQIAETIWGETGLPGVHKELDPEMWEDTRAAAQAVIDALGLHHVEGTDGEWRVVTAWQDTERPF